MSAHEKTHDRDRTLDKSSAPPHKSRMSSSSLFASPHPPGASTSSSSSSAHYHDPCKPSTSAAAAAASMSAAVAGPSSSSAASGDRHSSARHKTSTPVSPTNAASASHCLPPVDGDALAQHCRNVEDELQRLRDNEQRLKQQNLDVKRREHVLRRRLALKEQELQDCANQIVEFKNAQVPAPAALRTALLDPAVNLLLQKLRAELQATRSRLEDTQNELSAWKFTPDSNTGKRLMAKCRLLYQENEELGRLTSNGRMAKLEGDLALQKSFSEEVKKSQSELDDFLQELDEDVEGMQSTILFLQQELKTSKDTILTLETELRQLRESRASESIAQDAADLASGANGDAASEQCASVVSAEVEPMQSDAPGTPTEDGGNPASNGDGPIPEEPMNGKETDIEQRALNGKRSFDECRDVNDEQVQDGPVDGTLPTDCQADQQCTPSVNVVSAKKMRRASVQSLDLNEAECDDNRTIQLTCNGSGGGLVAGSPGEAVPVATGMPATPSPAGNNAASGVVL